MKGSELVQAKLQIGLGGALVATPWWTELFTNIHLIFGAVAAVCGAIVGVHAVWRVLRRAR